MAGRQDGPGNSTVIDSVPPVDGGRAEAQREIWLLPITTAIGVACYSLARGSGEALGLGLMVGAASFAAGMLLGFLFGIPRTLTVDGGKPEHPSESGGLEYQPNTNLEQISDWLTKILVGVGLVQIGQLRQSLGELARFLGPGFGGDATARAFAGALVVYSVVAGFLAGYLVTRLRLAGAFAYADRAALGRFVQRVARQTVDAQAARDAQALSLLTRQLDAGDVPTDELAAAVRDASRPAKIQSFLQAQRVRQDSWREKKPMLDRTVPIFRALIDADDDLRYHRHFGELGFVLKDKRPPDWEAADEMLSKAIEVRNANGARGYRIYEFNLALCRIHLDPAFDLGQPSTTGVREGIAALLRTAAQGVHSNRALANDPDVQRWLQQNDLTLDQITGASVAS